VLYHQREKVRHRDLNDASLPSLLDTADELEAVAVKLGAAAGDLHVGSDASETVVKRTALNDYRWSISRPMASSPGMSRACRTVARAQAAEAADRA
jgi:hypothetical protein